MARSLDTPPEKRSLRVQSVRWSLSEQKNVLLYMRLRRSESVSVWSVCCSKVPLQPRRHSGEGRNPEGRGNAFIEASD